MKNEIFQRAMLDKLIAIEKSYLQGSVRTLQDLRHKEIISKSAYEFYLSNYVKNPAEATQIVERHLNNCAFTHAVHVNELEEVKDILQEHKIDLDIEDNFALKHCIQTGNSDMFAVLVNAGSDLYQDVLFFEALNSDKEEIIYFYIHYAAKHKKEELNEYVRIFSSDEKINPHEKYLIETEKMLLAHDLAEGLSEKTQTLNRHKL